MNIKSIEIMARPWRPTDRNRSNGGYRKYRW